MAFDSGTTFGKRDISRVWSERARGGEAVSVSRVRGWSAAALLLLASAAAGWLAFTRLSEPPSQTTIIVAIGAAAASFALLWMALRVLAAVWRPGPVLRLDPTRIVLRGAAGQIVLPWEDVSLVFGRVYLTIGVGPTARLAEAGTPREIFVPVLLLPGGASGLRDAVRRVRPDVIRP
jgi:hypothetical protein